MIIFNNKVWKQTAATIQMKDKIWKLKCISRKAISFPEYGCII